MEWDLIIIGKWLILGLGGSSVGFAAAWLRARERALLAEERLRVAGRTAGPEQLDRLEQAVAAVAVEVERIGEVQRYAARLPGALPAAPPPASAHGERVITPH